MGLTLSMELVCVKCGESVEVTIPVNDETAGNWCLDCIRGKQTGVAALLDELLRIEKERFEIYKEEVEEAKHRRKKAEEDAERRRKNHEVHTQESRMDQERMIAVNQQLAEAQMANTRVVAEMAGLTFEEVLPDPEAVERRFEDLPDDDEDYDDMFRIPIDPKPIQDMTVEDFRKAERALLEIVAARHPGTTADDWQITNLVRDEGPFQIPAEEPIPADLQEEKSGSDDPFDAVEEISNPEGEGWTFMTADEANAQIHPLGLQKEEEEDD